MRLQKIAKVALLIGVFATFTAPMVLHAAAPVTSYSIEPIGGSIGLGNADLKTTVLNIIRLALGLMALVAVVLIIYGGFTWLTAAGNEENVEKAKRIISAAVIGLIIVLLAWAIVLFVANTTSNVTSNS